MTRTWVWGSFAVMALAGCQCDNPSECEGLTAEFISPNEGATVGSPFPVEVEARRGGAAVSFDSATLQAGDGGVLTGSLNAMKTRASFASVTAPAGTAALVATVKAGQCTVTRTRTVSVGVTCVPDITEVSFPQDTFPAGGDGTLNATELPAGTDMVVRVKVDPSCIVGLTARVTGGNLSSTAVALDASGQADVPVTVAGDGSYTLRAEILRGTTIASLSSDPQAEAAIAVRRTLPACLNLTPSTLGPASDLTGAPGLQFLMTGQTSADAGVRLMQFTVEDAGTLAVSLVDGGVTRSAQFTVAEASATYQSEVACTDEIGNVGRAARSLSVDYTPPGLQITSPLGCSPALTTYDAGARVVVTTAAAEVQGQQVVLNIRKADGGTFASGDAGTLEYQVGSARFDGGEAVADILFPDNGQFIIVARASDVAGNQGTATEGVAACTDGGTAPVVVASPLCSAFFARPAGTMGPATVLRTDVTGGLFRIDVGSNCASQPVTLTPQGGNPLASTLVSGQASFNVEATDGATVRYTACVENAGALTPPTCSSLDITYRLTRPEILVPQGPAVTLNVDDDLAADPGIQADLSFSAAAGLTYSVCSNQTPRPTGVSDCPGGGGYWVLVTGTVAQSPVDLPTFSFPDGQYNLKVVAESPMGRDESAPLAVTADSVRPCVDPAGPLAITGNPAALNKAIIDGAAPITFTFSVGCGDSPADIASATLTTECGTVNRGGSAANVGNAYSVPLNLGAFTRPLDATFEFGIRLVDQNGNTNLLCGAGADAAAIKSIVADEVAPVCDIGTPAASGAELGLAADAQPGLAGYQFRTVVNTSADVATTAVVTTVTGETSTAETQARTANAVTQDFTLPATGTSTVAVNATCTDAVGNARTATAVTGIILDRDAPTCTLVEPATGSESTVFSNSTRVDVSDPAPGVVNGRNVTVFANDAGIGTLVVDTSLSPSGARGTLLYPQGAPLRVNARVSDRAGNTCTTATNLFTVSSTQCTLAFTRPAGGGTVTVLRSQINPVSNEYSIQFSSSCTATAVTLTPEGQPALAGTTSGTGAASFNVPAQDGETIRYTACVDNVAGPDTCGDVVITYRLSQPTITNPTSALMPLNLNGVGDSSAAPGIQRPLSFTGPVGATFTVCSNQTPAPPGAPACPRAGGAGGYWVLASNVATTTPGFTFPDGQYDIIVVAEASGAFDESAPLNVRADSVRPCVSPTQALTVVGNPSVLNAALLAGPAPEFTFGLGCGDTPSTISQARLVTIADSLNRGGTVGSSGTTYTVPLNVSSFPANVDATFDFGVALTDINGNTNILTGAGVDAAAIRTIQLDRALPVCTIQSPLDSAILGLATDASGLAGFQVRTQVNTSADVTTGVATALTGITGTPETASRSGTVVTQDFTIPATGTNVIGVTATCTDDANNSSTATARTGILADRDAPTCTLVDPANGLSSGQFNIATRVDVSDTAPGVVNGRTVTVTSSGTQVGTLTVDTLLSPAGARGTLTYPQGLNQAIQATVSDTAGNGCTTSVNTIGVNAVGCAIAITGPTGTFINTRNADAGAGTALVQITGNSSSCRSGEVVTLFRGLPDAGVTVGTAGTSAAGDVSIPAVVSDNTVVEFTMQIDNGFGVKTETTPRSYTVDITPPTLTGLTPTGVSFVVAAGNINADGGTTYLLDADPGTTGSGEVAVSYSAGGAPGGKARLRLNGTPLGAEQTPATDPSTINFTAAVPHNTTGATLVAEVDDLAGNTTTQTISSSLSVDVQAPASPSVSLSLQDARAATVRASWGPVYDDGSNVASGGLSGGSPVAGYDIRWTTDSVPPFSGGLGTESAFFGSSARQESIEAWSSGTINRDLALPPLNTYSIAVRARDEVGNYSPYVAPSSLTNMWTRTTLTGPGGSRFGDSAVAANVVGDGGIDLVITAPLRGAVGSVYVYQGSALATDQATCASECQELSPTLPDGGADTLTGQFGSDLSTGGNVGDVATEGLPDVVVSRLRTGAAVPDDRGRVTIYFGTSAATLDRDAAIEIRGTTTYVVGNTAQIIPSIDGDTLDELAIAAPFYNGNQGRVLIYRGRTRAAWAALATGVDAATGASFIPLSDSNVDFVVNGPLPLLVSPAGNALGQNRRGLIGVGDINADARPDIAIPMSREAINQYRIYSGLAIAGSSPIAPLSASSYLVRFTEPTEANNATVSGLGAAAIGGVDLFDSAANDLLFSLPGRAGSGVLYAVSALGSSIAENPPRAFQINGPVEFGRALSAGKVDADGFSDLVAAKEDLGNSAWILYQRNGSFEVSQTVGTGTWFWASRFDGPTLTGLSTSVIGSASTVANLAGTASQDVVLGDRESSRVFIWW